MRDAFSVPFILSWLALNRASLNRVLQTKQNKTNKEKNKQINGKSILKNKYYTDKTQRDWAQEILKFRFTLALNDRSQCQASS